MSNNYSKSFILFVIIVAYLNTILIVIPGTSWTVFRLIIPFLILAYFRKYSADLIKFFSFSVFLLIYVYFISFLPINRFQNFDLIFSLHYVLVPFCFLIIKFFINSVGLTYLYRVFRNIHVVMLILGLFQFMLGGVYPNTQNRSPMINIFFWNENEFSATLAVFLPLFFLTEKKVLFKFLVTAVTLFFIAYSDARLLIIGLVLFFLI